MRGDLSIGPQRASGLVDVLDRVLDKGLVIAGDIRVSLAEVELLTIRIRLIVCSLARRRRWASIGGSTTVTSPRAAEPGSPRRTRTCVGRSVSSKRSSLRPSLYRREREEVGRHAREGEEHLWP